ncbi:Myosin type-2 heavy chain 1 [Physocladia obscura]|uniref:Myosin type-2 heavy chain 1 n=1 Tax=Physocladia obscura TaxID=109957 RepID=A0AAD5XFN8_9FUNG|nr:Myosin type-2 heavy chain 1 [Physocladia obscura]
METNNQIVKFSVPLVSLNADGSDLPPKQNTGQDLADNLSQLVHLHEPAVFFGVKNRFADERIYTYSGMVLIAMNPFSRDDSLYNEETMRDYVEVKKEERMPHIFGIAEECYVALLREQNQSVIVSGESGSGKTESTKYIMRYLAVRDALAKVDDNQLYMHPERLLNGIQKSETEEAVLASNPILESFGNAKTTRNDNSSRFGKFVELFFSGPETGAVRITGAKVRTYLLERSRLMFQPKDERNYHIFYQLCAAAATAERDELGLGTWDTFYYLNQGGVGVVKNVDDVKEFELTKKALSMLGLSVTKQWEIFRICAALLHVGNIKIFNEDDKEDAIIGLEDSSLSKAAELLGIDKFDFVKWVTKTQKIMIKDKILKPMNAKDSIISRDSVTKVIYTKLFDWLVKAINKNLKRQSHEGQHFIGVLDIYGFEHFKVNSFEQFCINYANEKLQQEFNAHVFRNEQEEYRREKLQWTNIEFSDNKECIELIEMRMGILPLLDEESRLQSGIGSDTTFMRNMTQHLSTHKYWKKGRFGNTDFTIMHYAVDVTYNSAGFVEKNKDSMSEELQAVLEKSSNLFLKELFVEEEIDAESLLGVVRQNSTVQKLKKPTLGSMFKNSLEELMTTIRATEGHYIRCIKPNMEKEPFKFTGPMVLSQLKACGVLETIKISSAGYPSKVDYAMFCSRYSVLISSNFWNMDKKELAQKIVFAAGIAPELYQFGETKIGLFEDKRKARNQKYVTLLSKNARRFMQRQKFLRLKAAAIYLQSVIRGAIVRKQVAEEQARQEAIRIQRETEIRQQNAAIKIQSAFRRVWAFREYKVSYEYVVFLQTAIRIRFAKKQLGELRKEAKSVDKIKENFANLESRNYKLDRKVVELSQALTEKTIDFKKLQEKCVNYELEIRELKEKLESADIINKSAAVNISALQNEVTRLAASEAIFAAEKDRLTSIVMQAKIDGFIISVTENASRSNSISRAASPARGFSPAPVSDRGASLTRNQIKKQPNGMLETPPTAFPALSRGRTISSAMPPASPTMARGQTISNSFPSLARSKTLFAATQKHEDPTIVALRAEIDTLKAALTTASSTSSTGLTIDTSKLPIRPRPTRTATLREKSIFEQDIVDDAEVAHNEKMNRASTTTYGFRAAEYSPASTETVHILPRTSSMVKPQKSTNANRDQILMHPNFVEIVCDILIAHSKTPKLNLKLTPVAREIFYPAYFLSNLFSIQIEEGFLKKLDELCNRTAKNISSLVKESQDGTQTAFWISNVYQLQCGVAFLYNREVMRPNNKPTVFEIREIQTTLSNLLEADLLPTFISRLREQTGAIAGPAILENQDLEDMRVETGGGFWGVFAGAENPGKNAMLDLKVFLTNVDRILRNYLLPDALYWRIMMELFRTMGVVAFNGFIMKRNFLNFKRAMQVQYNLQQLGEFAGRLGLQKGFQYLTMVSQAARILTYNKNDSEDVETAYETAFLLNASQIYKLYSNYPTRDVDSPITPEFLELVKNRASATSNRDIIPVSLEPEPEYPRVPVFAAEKLEIYIPETLEIPEELRNLLQ